jgi:acyl-CoA synthetase (AMP-forming)/AMP-acid ligase II
MLSSPHLLLFDPSPLRILSCGGSPLAPTVVRRAVGAFGCEFFVSYGMTECCGKVKP